MDYGCWYLLSRSCADTNTTATSSCMHGFDSVMGFILIMCSICSGNEFGWHAILD